MAEEAFWDRLKGAEILAFQAFSCSPLIHSLSAGSNCTPSGGQDLTCPLARSSISLATAVSFHLIVA